MAENTVRAGEASAGRPPHGDLDPAVLGELPEEVCMGYRPPPSSPFMLTTIILLLLMTKPLSSLGPCRTSVR